MAPIVCQYRFDRDGADFLKSMQKVGATFFTLIRIHLHVDPARSAVNGNKQVAPLLFVRHLWQVFDINMDEPSRIIYERFLGR